MNWKVYLDLTSIIKRFKNILSTEELWSAEMDITRPIFKALREGAQTPLHLAAAPQPQPQQPALWAPAHTPCCFSLCP